MFIKTKPVRFGFKIWMLCGSDGYLYNTDIYHGRSADNNKEPLGTRADYRSDGHLIFVKWNDNAIVTVGSNHYGVTPLHKTARRVKEEHKKDVQQPNAMKKYNERMGRVDLLD
ncbi:hypothetical protein ILUMI_25368 [Ignelater luminosus]|uniref:PiggyBac transposable element-derived protein domain-containing protein n=1 Tax=Ignelater luminosus TaxID=2038154 RepID=A0A8K0C8P6_IGNLU|nr:hypothetical protein ILUMI_25368 [Ignelater luminosus]